MSYYFCDGNIVKISKEGNFNVKKELPVGTYVLKIDKMSGTFYLEKVDNFKELSRYYGNTIKYAEKIFNTFKDRDVSTGAIFAGEKGSGKTLLAKKICNIGYEQGISTIIINDEYTGDSFNKFIQDIDCECIVLFDEFEKVYKPESQESILTLLDGVYPTKKLFLLTSNNINKVDFNMKNRPGRIFYSIEYKGLDQDFIREYCEENLKDKSQIDSVVKSYILFDQINFDMLKGIVEEMNRYNETLKEAIKLLNVSFSSSSYNFSIELYIDGKRIDEEQLYVKTIRTNPIVTGHTKIFYYETQKETNNELKIKDNSYDEDCTTIVFYNKELISFDKVNYVFYKKENNSKLILKRVIDEEFNYSNYL